MAIVKKTVARHAAPSASNDSYYGTLTESALRGSFDVLANDSAGSKLYSVHSFQPAKLGNVRHGGTVNAPKAAISVESDGMTYNGWASVGSGGKVNVDFGGSAGALDALRGGEQATGTFWYTARLSNGTYGAAKVTFTITGQNDAASITGQNSGEVTEDGANTVGGMLQITDPDRGEAAFQAPILAGTYGNFTFSTATGAWTYTLDNSKLGGVDAGETVQDTMTVTSLDGTDSETITVTINGADEVRSGVLVFDNPAFVDTSGDYGAEADNIAASAEALGHVVTKIVNYDAASLEAALAQVDVFILPEQENGSLAYVLTQDAEDAISNFVSDGGTLIVSSDYRDFLNQVFEFSTTLGYPGSDSTKQPDADGTTFADDFPLIPPNNATLELHGLPAGTLNIYSDGDGSTVSATPYGDGWIIHLGWDWFDAAPIGSLDGGWLQVLDSAITF